MTQRTRENDIPSKAIDCLFSESNHESNFKVFDTLKSIPLNEKVELLPLNRYFEPTDLSARGAVNLLFEVIRPEEDQTIEIQRFAFRYCKNYSKDILYLFIVAMTNNPM